MITSRTTSKDTVYTMAERPNVFRPVNLSEVFRSHDYQAEADSFLPPLTRSAILSHVGCLGMVLRTIMKKGGHKASQVNFSYAVCYERTGQPKTVNINVSAEDIAEDVFKNLVQQAHLSVPCQQALEKVPVKVHAYADVAEVA